MSAIQPLTELGFTELEAELYTLLLDEPATTGYHLAKLLKKPAPNVYKALESLEAKGAVMVDDGHRRLCRAVPPEEVLGQLERTFQRTRKEAAKALENRRRSGPDQRIYQLHSTRAVLERVRSMLQQAREVVLMDAFPEPVRRLQDDLASAAARGVTTALIAYRPVALPGVEVVINSVSRETRERWPGQWLNLVVDGRQCVISFLSSDLSSVHQALWSGSPYLAWTYHSALSSELLYEDLAGHLKAGEEAPKLRQRLNHLKRIKALRSPGYRELLQGLEEDNANEQAP